MQASNGRCQRNAPNDGSWPHAGVGDSSLPTPSRPWQISGRGAGVPRYLPLAEFVEEFRIKWQRSSAHADGKPAGAQPSGGFQTREGTVSTRSCRSPLSDRMTGPHCSPAVRWRREERRAPQNAVIKVRGSTATIERQLFTDPAANYRPVPDVQSSPHHTLQNSLHTANIPAVHAPTLSRSIVRLGLALAILT